MDVAEQPNVLQCPGIDFSWQPIIVKTIVPCRQKLLELFDTLELMDITQAVMGTRKLEAFRGPMNFINARVLTRGSRRIHKISHGIREGFFHGNQLCCLYNSKATAMTCLAH